MSKYIVNPELEARLTAQRRASSIASLFVGLLLMALLALLFWLIGIQIFSFKEEPMVAFNEEPFAEE